VKNTYESSLHENEKRPRRNVKAYESTNPTGKDEYIVKYQNNITL
jgi:hypothetical protein